MLLPNNILFILNDIGTIIIVISFLFLLLGGIIISIKTRFIQIRMIPLMFKLLFRNPRINKSTLNKTSETISPKKALFTAMATMIGLGNIAAPIVAIKLGGPGALLGFLLATIFGGASVFAEVTFAVSHRKKNKDGSISGGPMQYLKDSIHPSLAHLYSIGGIVLFIAWAMKQSNTLGDLLHPYNIPKFSVGIGMALATSLALLGGIKQIGKIAEKLVPIMFIMYTVGAMWIILSNISQLPYVIRLIFKSAFTKEALTGSGVGYGFMLALRWGLAKGFYSNVAGIGVTAIPHSMTSSDSPTTQGILAIVSVYSAGFLCLLSGLVILLTGAWTDNSQGIGINIIAQTFSEHLPYIGTMIIIICGLLFSFGTVLGNAYNGEQCFRFSFKKKHLTSYFLAIILAVFIGTMVNAKIIWTITDFFVIPVAIPNIIGIVILSFKEKHLLRFKTKNLFKNF